MEALVPLLTVFKDPVNVLLILALIGQQYLHLQARKEDQKDREAMVHVQEKMVEALNAVRNALSAIVGKAV